MQSYKAEFETVDLLESSTAETRGVDAFSLALIKAERQVRKLFTYLIFQFPIFSIKDVNRFREVLGENKKVYFDGFITGIDELYPKSIKDLIGDDYDKYHTELQCAINFRNKIFHGQLTNKKLSREDLFALVTAIQKWCERLATETEVEFGYDGFARNSLRKHTSPIWKNYRVNITSYEEYGNFIKQYMER